MVLTRGPLLLLPDRPFTAAQAEAAGLERWTLHRLVDRREVRRLLRGVYVRADVKDTLELRVAAVALVAPEHAVLVDRTASWVCGSGMWTPEQGALLPRIDAYVLSDGSRIRRPEAGGGRRDLRPETWCWLTIHDEQLPLPDPQVWVAAGDGTAYRLDFAYERLKICVEYDGEEHHSSDEAKARDRARRRWLRDRGWVVIVLTKDDLRGPAREAWLAELRYHLQARGHPNLSSGHLSAPLSARM